MKIYMAFSITSNNHPVEFWKSSLKECVTQEVEWLDPLRYGLNNDTDWKEIIKRNVADIAQADLVIAYLDSWSWGVISECNIAKMLGVPVVGYRTKNWVRSPYEKNCVKFVSGSINKIAEFVNKYKKHDEKRKVQI